jgi:hypothetical protein
MSDPLTPSSLPKPAAAPAAVARVGPTSAGAARPPERRALLRRSAALLRRWARDTFNRESFLSSLRSLLWVAPLTLLIWIYAEREQQIPGTARFQIAIKSADPAQVASFANANDQNVTATLKGPKARLDEAKEKLDPRSSAGPVQILIDGNRPPGQYQIDILSQIQKDFRLDNNGITVVDCTPRDVRVDVDALQEVELEVKADPQARFVAPPVFNPPRVKLTAPASAIKTAKGELFARANLPRLTQGPHTLNSVPVTVEGLSDPKGVVVRPSAVSASVEVGQADMSFTIPSLPVFPVPTPDVWQKQTIRYTQFLPNVNVYGPPDKIEQLKNGTLKPTPEARFKVTDNDVGGKKVTRELDYVLPQGISKGDDAPKQIEFELVPREPS